MENRDYMGATIKLKFEHSQIKLYEKNLEDWKREHPLKARISSGPKALLESLEFYRGRASKERELQSSLDSDPRFQESCRLLVKESQVRINEAKRELEVGKPIFDDAAHRREEKRQELEKQRQQDRSRGRGWEWER